MPLGVRLKMSKTGRFPGKRIGSGGGFVGGNESKKREDHRGSRSGFAGGMRSKRREDDKGQGSDFADGNRIRKREDRKGHRESAGRWRQQSENVSRLDGEMNVSGVAARKRNRGAELLDYDDKRTSSSEAKVFGKSRLPMHRKLSNGKFFARKGDRSNSGCSDEDDLRPEGGTNRKVPDTNRGVSSRLKHGKNVGASMDRENTKGKFDKSAKVGAQKGDANNVELEENAGKIEQADQIAKENRHRPPSRVLDKTGKKIRVSKKDLDTDEVGPPKRRKRMKIDPYDMSNKRLDDTALHPDEKIPKKIAEKSPQAEIELSINAKFRAIQPSPSILSFVEDNLLGRRRLNEIKNAGYNTDISAPLDNVPFSTSNERERIEENVFRNKLEFFAAAKVSSSLPPPTIPEVAFAGISNVGKSSLLNALTRQWGVVRTSDKPGLTQTINFFRLASKLCLVDLPGYGFAYAKDEVKESWQELVKEYVSTRVGLQRVCLLIHTKRGMKPLDYELVDLMERSQTPYQIVLTKTDLVFPIDVARRAMEIQESLKNKTLAVDPVMMVSSKSGAGIRNFRTVLGKLARFIKP